MQINTSTVRLLYLYCDAVGEESAEHRQELGRFQAQIEKDPIRFASMSVQEFILRAVSQVRADQYLLR